VNFLEAKAMNEVARILIAEDNAADVWLIREALKRQSIPSEIEHYTTAEEAIRAIGRCGGEASIPDLILLDYNLPTGDGGEVLAAAASNPHLAEVPKAILSSHMRPHELDLMLRLGACRFISKPANLHEFLSVVGRTVHELLKGSCESSKS
jgi:two-component system, chemotaxis family, response regulator Rcp1